MGNNPSRQQPDKHRRSEKSGYITHYTPYTPREKEKTSVGWRPDVKDPAVFADSKLGDVKQRIPAPESASTPKPKIKSASELSDAEKESAIVRNLIFWRNAFQVCILSEENGGEAVTGEIISYDSPEGLHILQEINAGFAPPTLFKVKHGQPVCIYVYNNKSQDAPSDSMKVGDPASSSNDDPAADQCGVPNFDVKRYLDQLPLERPDTEHPADLPHKIEDLQSGI